MLPEQRCVLITGGAGYIGSHTTIEVLKAGYTAVVIDNLCNSNIESIGVIEQMTGKRVHFYQLELQDADGVRKVFKKHKICYVMHFAGLKAVGESCVKPLMYYKNNMESTFNLLEVMVEFEVFNIVFSSSATVYGVPQYLPVDEKHPSGACTNPYGRTKYYVEQLLNDMCAAEKRWNVVLLRYFNPAGSHESGLIGEDPQGPPNNLMPFVAQVSVGRRDHVQVFGDDYNTPDGTGVRDYIHVVDLALGHVAALSKLEENCGMKIYNLGTGQGYSVLDMIKAYEKASGRQIPYKMVGRRVGDVDSCYADPKTASSELGWKATRGLEEMCEDLWRWQSNNPQGFVAQKEEVKEKKKATTITNGHDTTVEVTD